MPATEQIRKKIRSLLLGASKSLEDAFRVHDDGLVLEVQCAVQELLTLFKEFHLSACDPYLRFNANGALTGFNILINFCTTFESDCRFTRLHDVLDLGIKRFSDRCFGHDEDQISQVINDLHSFKLTLLPLQAHAIGQRSYSSVVRFALIITPPVF